MKRLTLYIFLFIATLFFNCVFAQTEDMAKHWTLAECLQYAAVHNIQIATLRLNEQSAAQNLIAAKGQKIPSLSASVGNTFTNSNNETGTNGGLVNQLTVGGTYAISSSVVLWNDNLINNNIRQNELLEESAGLSVQESQNNITLSITQAYLNILLSKENEKYAIDLVNTTTSIVKQGQLLYDAGSIAKVALLQLQAQLASDKYLLVETRNAIRQNILVLKQLLQLPPGTAFDISIPASIEAAPVLPSLQAVQQAALNNFPEIKIGKLGIDIAALDIARAKAGFKPVLDANAALGTSSHNVLTNNVAPKSAYFTQTGNNFYQSLWLTLSIPIFSNRINKTNVAKTNIAYKQANLNYENSQLILSQQVEQAYLDAVNAQQAYDAANEQLITATESYRIVNEEFKLGGLNIYDLLQQRNQYVQAIQAFTQAKYTSVLQQKIYEFYMGKPVTL